ncbi:hypothetical protein IW139_001898 [Coemansia sp. RSA 353]|nr:hypothetical protein GGH16_001236 [Coemansia sp. RSA 560]KAJ2188866.1 hypothetical protein EV181_001959 [Coemansia sp. RSA 532]KAJ2228095.1 hypothetical protein EV180_002150 [Coemansia sp. RSA 518]KAJ2247100.1 hypothetical protein GGH97_002237 [Coemansia sp. RSA 475]KAJ2299133.1 hypothetical protein IW139_001898 [Coemansia sp. RSA 353]
MLRPRSTATESDDLDSSDSESQTDDVVREAVDIAEGLDLADSSDDRSASTPDPVRHALDIASGDSPATQPGAESLEAAMEKMEQLDIGRQDSTHTFVAAVSATSEIQVVLLQPEALLSEREHAEDVGFNVKAIGEHVLIPGTVTKIPLGIAAKPPAGTFLKVESRSSLALQGIVTVGGIIVLKSDSITKETMRPIGVIVYYKRTREIQWSESDRCSDM